MSNTIKYPFLDLATVNAPFIDAIHEATSRVINSGYYVGGPEVVQFEQKLADATGCRYAVGVSNGLDAIRLIFHAYIQLGRLRPGDEVIVPANTYIASILAVIDAGLAPVFVEPDIATLNLDTARLSEAITPRTRAILTVHLYGRTCYDATMADLAKRHNLLIVEDNAQAIGARDYRGKRTGALGDAGAFSFYPTKNIGALGDAGAVTTDDPDLANAVRALSNYGSDRKYHNIYLGYNCRLDPIQAAIVALKLPYIDSENAIRADVAKVYNDNISNPLIIKPQYSADGTTVWHQYVILANNRDRLRQYLLDHGVATDVHYPTAPHHQPCMAAYANLHLPVAERIAAQAVSLPISRCTSTADAADIARIINSWTDD